MDGFIAPFDFLGMLFNNEITMYAQNNNGGFYALGFLLGAAAGDSSGVRGFTGFNIKGFTTSRKNLTRRR